MTVYAIEVVESFEREQRLQRKCTVCEKRRLTTRQKWRVVGVVEIETFDAFVCNPCLCATPPWTTVRRVP